MRFMLLQGADRIPVLVITGVVMNMEDILRIAADRFRPRIPLFIRLIALVCMRMHCVLAVKHFHLMRHCLAVQLQRHNRSIADYHSQTQKNHCTASVLFLFLQVFCCL